ncbi:STAS domain-containing protein [Catenuloplanes atrovinosus]|uniref:Anti-anti-sigma factor n=1 Tax=Catenuloplanes atrovinosus TaxID=137266 RepID=A0AAE3YQM6_9ACTN|nr:STAS domain-containing protein [Catenuloplanes atrovinosus]MDR7276856.1 anti-anti-sigma factor [Catenuloplanes atrovinosus]
MPADARAEFVMDLVSRLPEPERTLVTLRRSGVGEAEIAARLGLTPEQASQSLTRAFAWLRRAMLAETVPDWSGAWGLRIGTEFTAPAEVRLTVTGEIDRDNAAELGECVLAALGAELRPAVLTLDLAGVPLLDVAAARVLRAASEAAASRGTRIELVRMSPAVRAALRVCGLDPLVRD